MKSLGMKKHIGGIKNQTTETGKLAKLLAN